MLLPMMSMCWRRARAGTRGKREGRWVRKMERRSSGEGWGSEGSAVGDCGASNIVPSPRRAVVPSGVRRCRTSWVKIWKIRVCPCWSSAF